MNEGLVGQPMKDELVGKGWRGFFWAACAFNLIIGSLSMLSPVAVIDTRIVGLLVVCFGIVYFLVARDPIRFAPTLWAGVIGKLGVVGLLAPSALSPDPDFALGAVLAVDALFAMGFVVFLFKKDDDFQ